MWSEINYEPVTAPTAIVGWTTVNTLGGIILEGTMILFEANTVETLTVRVPSMSSPGGGFKAGGPIAPESVYPSLNTTRISPLSAVPLLFDVTGPTADSTHLACN